MKNLNQDQSYRSVTKSKTGAALSKRVRCVWAMKVNVLQSWKKFESQLTTKCYSHVKLIDKKLA
jgi:hypothetical protein